VSALGLVLLGAPGSGKGTQALRLEKELGLVKISTGDMLRSARAAGTELGRSVAAVMDAGQLVSDDLVLALVKERLAEADVERGFVLDGFPRTLPQAEALDKLLSSENKQLDRVVLLDVPRELLVERATLRRTDVRTGQIYHLKYSPPPDGAELMIREDDRPDTVRARLDGYDNMTSSLIPYYDGLGLLARVDGVGAPATVAARLAGALSVVNGRRPGG
jgi:adenylate kinase